MSVQKLYAGAKLRETRTHLGLTQKAFAEKLSISLPYLNQMENNHRPISSAVILALVQEFGFDVSELAIGDGERMVTDLREALADPLFKDTAPALLDLRLIATNAPAMGRAFLALHRAYMQTNERFASLDEALGSGEVRPGASPWEEVRDFFHYCDNYIDAVDRAAERFAGDRSADAAITDMLSDLGIAIRLVSEDALIRRFDPQAKTLTLSASAPQSTRRFQALHQIALLTKADLLEATLDFARFQSDQARDIAKIGLANYFAGAALMPYGSFLDFAKSTRHDIEKLAHHFGASLEQVSHRLSTLQRPGAKGVPVFFVRVDQAGTITKRHSATRLQFARYGGACPLWNVHSAFETPGQFIRQLAETPDGVRYLCLAREVTHGGGAWRAPVRRYAIGLGCEISHASEFVYSDGLDTSDATTFEAIGISCRICPRADCHQRSLPPLERTLQIDHNSRKTLPYEVVD
ncbi:helix-turn-helix transcriptional regulator [uncultured Boseongicola sp.]|jgi:predicted transcriptional regulator/transcriptional regulator with XRE-family HTH domain|uniref:helix-turn-helix domain-containing protein n=1 Tax=uncultured Boseongicola sp. TaxID=1648499 RepID=UPI002623B0F9|nr:helix-turn-helix transcriptional regulator [uncultured Boseongicola sp.]